MGKLRSPLKWHGGKSYLAKLIVSLMPEHAVYVEPFIGGGSVLLNKPRSLLEYACDANPQLINFWRIMSGDEYPSLDSALCRQSYSAESFEAASARLNDCDPCNRAAAFMVRNRMSRGGLGKTFAWSDRMRGGQPGDVNAWQTIIAELPRIHGRVGGVRFRHCNAIDMLAEAEDYYGVFAYLDPPYLHETRTATKAYEHEMSHDDHAELLSYIGYYPRKVMISGYRSQLYDEMLNDWRRVDIDMPNHSGQGAKKQRRTECLWMNYWRASDRL